MSTISHRRRGLTATPALVRPEDAFAAGPELAAVLSQRVTDASTRSARYSSVKNVIIGSVPDRGGRVGEMALSARDLMPEWQPRKADSGVGAGGARGGRGGGRGGAARPVSSAKPVASAGGGASVTATCAGSGGDHDVRARALLAEAAKFEGEAAVAALEYDRDDTGEGDGDGDVDMAGRTGNLNNRRGRGGGKGKRR